ncbi:MAG: AraC family transcriptional regulator [Oscillospiraceae bacterium]|nr:AraC family transcriptional regulator [Oscillospiraceae bacterium]
MDRKVKILWVERAEWPNGWGIRPHSHEYYHLFYFLNGKTTFSIDKKKCVAKKGVCFIVPPRTLHELAKTTGETVTCYEVKFSLYDEKSRDNLFDCGPVFTGNSVLEEMVRFIVDNGLSRISECSDAAEATVYALITYLTRERYESAPHARNSQLIDTTGFSEITVLIMSYIEQNYTQQINLDMIASSIGYNRNYICSAFKKDTDITIIEYLNFVRIRQAAIYFSYSDMEISLTSARVGFINISHFNRTFKKFTGISPSTFKKLHSVKLDVSMNDRENRSSALEGRLSSIAEAFGIFAAMNTGRAEENQKEEAQ